MASLKGKTIFITGASRGIGKAIALRAAQDGANIVIAAKTAKPHPKLHGTIYTACKEIEDAGGKCLPCIVDVRNESDVRDAVEKAVAKFGGIDILVNNASAINLSNTDGLPMKSYDLMNSVNARGTFLCSKICHPYLVKSAKAGRNPHILNLSPPLNMKPKWFGNHVAYTMSKYGMSMCVLGMAEEFKNEGIAVNALWPESTIVTAATAMMFGEEKAKEKGRFPEIMADAAHVIFTKTHDKMSGRFLLDTEVLQNEGVTNFDKYSTVKSCCLISDFFLDNEQLITLKASL